MDRARRAGFRVRIEARIRRRPPGDDRRVDAAQRAPAATVRARHCGALFFLGHGAAGIAIAAAVGVAASRWDAPARLEASGAWISIGFLALIGLVNLRAVPTAAPDEIVAPAIIDSHFPGWLGEASRPVAVALVGALFALSFDTVSQSALLGLAAAQFGGVGHAIGLALTFALRASSAAGTTDARG